MADAICQCGRAIKQESVGRRRKFCKTCRPPTLKDAGQGAKQPVAKQCEICLKVFYSKLDRAKLCGSEKCKWKARTKQPCDQCGRPTGWSHTDKRSQKAVCLRCRRDKPKPTSITSWTCDYCGKQCTRKPVGGSTPRYCGKKHEQLASFNRRRARKLDAFVEEVSRIEVFEADGYKCHLCGRKTDPTKSVPHRRAPTIDHIVPLSKGGLHERLNCRTACFSCNCSKGDRGGGEQLLLIS